MLENTCLNCCLSSMGLRLECGPVFLRGVMGEGQIGQIFRLQLGET